MMKVWGGVGYLQGFIFGGSVDKVSKVSFGLLFHVVQLMDLQGGERGNPPLFSASE